MLSNNACNGVTCKQIGQSMHIWQLSGGYACNKCEKSFDPTDVKLGKNDRRLCPCCHQILRINPRCRKSKLAKTLMIKAKIIKK